MRHRTVESEGRQQYGQTAEEAAQRGDDALLRDDIVEPLLHRDTLQVRNRGVDIRNLVAHCAQQLLWSAGGPDTERGSVGTETPRGYINHRFNGFADVEV